MNFIKYTAYILTLMGALNWGLIGLFDFNLFASIFGETTTLARVAYSVVGISAIITAMTMHSCKRIEEIEICEYGDCKL